MFKKGSSSFVQPTTKNKTNKSIANYFETYDVNDFEENVSTIEKSQNKFDSCTGSDLPINKLCLYNKKGLGKSLRMANHYTSLSSSSSSSDSRTIGKNKHESSSSSSRESSSSSGNDNKGLNFMKNCKKTHAVCEPINDQMSPNKKIIHGSSSSPPVLISYNTDL